MSKSIIMAVLAFIIAGGGTFGGYKVIKDYKRYGTDFETRTHKVVRVIDGDTIEIEKKIKIRLLGINAPETGKCYYKESKNFLKDLLENKEFTLEKDKTGKDKYGRLLRHITIKDPNPENLNMHVNNKLLLKGYAFRYTLSPDIKYRELFVASEIKAKKAKRGMWGACDYLEKQKTTQKLRQKDTKPKNKKCIIKGNVSEKGYGKIYSIPGCSNYNRVKIDPSRGDKYFCTEAQARHANFTKSKTCPK